MGDGPEGHGDRPRCPLGHRGQPGPEHLGPLLHRPGKVRNGESGPNRLRFPLPVPPSATNPDVVSNASGPRPNAVSPTAQGKPRRIMTKQPTRDWSSRLLKARGGATNEVKLQIRFRESWSLPGRRRLVSQIAEKLYLSERTVCNTAGRRSPKSAFVPKPKP
jgi:hypothetical protein